MSDGQIQVLQSEGGAASPGPGAPFGAEARATPRIPEELSILPLRGFVMFPGTIMPLTVNRPASIKLLDETLSRTKIIGLLNQRDEEKEEPTPQDLYHVGTAALVLKLLRQSDEQIVMIVQGIRRFAIRKIVATAAIPARGSGFAGIDFAAASLTSGRRSSKTCAIALPGCWS